MKVCYQCNRKNGPGGAELRPYGPRGEWVCFDCAFATPKAQAQTEASFVQQLNAAEQADEDGVAAIGTEAGPIPLRTLSEGKS